MFDRNEIGGSLIPCPGDLDEPASWGLNEEELVGGVLFGALFLLP